ncbi:hypothetical protein BVH06_15570 [Pseudomonas sp. PA27(2017)]|nr:hypothetical protein BVH06_15570 [Pseudomonas sp. PA27(2017)]
MGLWSDYFGEYIAQLKTARIDGQVMRLNHFGDYLLTLEYPPAAPEFVQRQFHINDATKLHPNTFWSYIDQLGINPASASSIISQIRYFFDWYIESLHTKENGEIKNLKNPVLQTDKFGSRRNHSQTKRNALPSYVLNELKDILIVDDFAFSKSMKLHYVKVVDKETGHPDRVWFPAINNCLYMMLEMPVRSHQARWLDSGELDEEVFDEKLGVMVQNQSPYRILGRKECALRLHHDGLRQKDWLGLWINTNKTASYDGRDIGYSIPYASNKLSELLRDSIRWANRYTPPMSRPIAYYGDKQSTADRERMSEKGPQVTPLFRDPSLFDPNTPISYRRLSIYYTFVLQEAQTRIQKKYGHNLKLVETNENGKLSWLVDLHTLRVSGITSMIESGVPLEIVSMFVAGHQTLVMTLHYLRYSPLKIRELMSEAHEKSLSNMDMVGSEMFMEDFEHFSQFLLGKDGQGQGSGCDAIRLKTGIMTIGVDGICPGTSCSDGGPVDSTRVIHGPVPGGQRCGLCRHWLTGPGFLLGQVASVNNLAYGIRKKGLELAKLNDDRLTYEDEGNQRKARELRDRADLLNRELAIDIEEWVARYQYAEQSLVLLDEYVESVEQRTGKGKQVALLSSSSAAELKVTLEESHEFALLDQITQMAEFVTGFPNREAELEKHSILSRMLVSNGMDPFLLRLNEAQAREASNLMSALLLQQVESQHLNDVLSGNKKLSAYPNLMAVIGALESNGDAQSHRVAEAVNRQNFIECVEL